MRAARLLALRRWITTLVTVLFAFGLHGAVVSQVRCARAHAAVRTLQSTGATASVDAPTGAVVTASDEPPAAGALHDADGSRPCAPALAALPAEPADEPAAAAWDDVFYPGRAPPSRIPSAAIARLDRPPRT